MDYRKGSARCVGLSNAIQLNAPLKVMIFFLPLNVFVFAELEKQNRTLSPVSILFLTKDCIFYGVSVAIKSTLMCP